MAPKKNSSDLPTKSKTRNLYFNELRVDQYLFEWVLIFRENQFNFSRIREKSEFVALELVVASNEPGKLSSSWDPKTNSDHPIFQWYFVTKIVLTYCEKKLF